VLLTTWPVLASTQNAPSAMWPTGRIAERSLSETPITCVFPPLAIFISSPRVLTSRRRGDAPPSLDPPSSLTESSDTLVTRLPVDRSNHSLATMPLTLGRAPLRKVLCPIAVTVG